MTSVKTSLHRHSSIVEFVITVIINFAAFGQDYKVLVRKTPQAQLSSLEHKLYLSYHGINCRAVKKVIVDFKVDLN